MVPVVVLIAVAYANTPAVLWTVSGGVAVAAVGGAFTYAWQRRTTSGSIEHSNAGDLWAESKALRAEYKEEVISLRQQVSDLTVALQQALDREFKYVERIAVLEREVHDLKGAA